MTEFEKWFRDYMEASINSVDIHGGSVSGEQEIKDVSAKVEELLQCEKSVEDGKAVCGVKLDCHLHDWRQDVERIVGEEMDGMEFQTNVEFIACDDLAIRIIKRLRN